MWKACRYARNTAPRQACLPPLNRNLDPLSAPDLVNSPQTKAKLLQTSFFPSPPKPDLSDISGYIYPTPAPMPLITQKEIEKAIFKPAQDRAPGNDNIPNQILRLASPHLSLPLFYIFNACLEIGYCPDQFRTSVTIAMRKPGKKDYSDVKSYVRLRF